MTIAFIQPAAPIEAARVKHTIQAKETTAEQLARKILLEVMRFRRIAGSKKSCATSTCDKCLKPHLIQVVAAIEAQQPITFVLPAFPGKSPNPAKVLGTIPDMAEQRSLEFLEDLCQRIKTLHPPGAHIILCSDGRVFNDIVGMRNVDVTAYQQAISRMIHSMSLTSLSTFNLDDVYTGLNFIEMRDRLMATYGEPIETLKDAVRQGSKMPCSMDHEEVNRQYCGITRFLVEDASHPGQHLSRTALQKTCRERAYVVVQRSRAWSELIAERFPHAVRLSIHPQSCGSKKIGIRLIQAESWMTPWHGVALEIEEEFVLLKRAEAEILGAELIYREGRASHYKLIDETKISRRRGGFL